MAATTSDHATTVNDTFAHPFSANFLPRSCGRLLKRCRSAEPAGPVRAVGQPGFQPARLYRRDLRAAAGWRGHPGAVAGRRPDRDCCGDRARHAAARASRAARDAWDLSAAARSRWLMLLPRAAGFCHDQLINPGHMSCGPRRGPRSGVTSALPRRAACWPRSSAFAVAAVVALLAWRDGPPASP